MSSVQTIQKAYAAFAKDDPSVLFGAIAPDIQWREAEGNLLADRNPYVGAHARAGRPFRSNSTPTLGNGRN